MGLEKIVPAISLIAVLILVLPAFLRSNSKLKQFLKNLSVWAIIVLTITIVSYFIFWIFNDFIKKTKKIPAINEAIYKSIVYFIINNIGFIFWIILFI